MSNDPSSVPLDRVERALKLIGLNPVNMSTLQSVHIAAGCITVVRYRLNQDANRFALPGRNELATETVTIAVVDE